MEIAIPLVLLGATYILTDTTNTQTTHTQPQSQKESFVSQNALPNTQVPVDNYPTPSVSSEPQPNEQYTAQAYPNPNDAANTYLDQSLYQSNQRAGKAVGGSIQQIHSISGDYMNTDEFTHNNMVPFTRRKPGGDTSNLDNAEGYLDYRAGMGSQRINKVEQAPLFAPTPNMHYVHGVPSTSDFMQSRVNPSQCNNMVRPFEQQRVGPGLSEKYGSAGSGGFNSGMECRDAWLPKSVNELRTAINPKDEYTLGGLQGPAASAIQNRGVLGKTEKYAPDTYYINSQDRWFTTTGAEKGPRAIAEQVQHQSHREETSTSKFGPANSTLKTASYTPSHYTPSTRPELLASHVRPSNAGGRAPAEGMDNRQQGVVANNTKRQYTSCDGEATFGSGFRSAVGAVIAPIMDILQPTRKEDYTCTSRLGNTGVDGTGIYIRSADGGVDMTTKETTLHQTRGNIGYQTSDGYKTNRPIPVEQNRNTTDAPMFTGAGSGRGSISYKSHYEQAPHGAKEATLASHTNGGNMKLFNNEVNVALKGECHPTWYTGASSGTNAGPSLQTYGTQQMGHEMPELGVERIQPAILDAFKSNPYTHSLYSTA